jgi:hypothetical protein
MVVELAGLLVVDSLVDLVVVAENQLIMEEFQMLVVEALHRQEVQLVDMEMLVVVEQALLELTIEQRLDLEAVLALQEVHTGMVVQVD